MALVFNAMEIQLDIIKLNRKVVVQYVSVKFCFALTLCAGYAVSLCVAYTTLTACKMFFIYCHCFINQQL